MAKAKVDKVLVTNRGALQAKYGAGYAGTLAPALAALIAADKARGLVTRLVRVDHAADMAKYSAAAVTNAAERAPEQGRRRCDLCRAHAVLRVHRRRARRGPASAARQSDSERRRRHRVERLALRVRRGLQHPDRPFPAAVARGRAAARPHGRNVAVLSRGAARHGRGGAELPRPRRSRATWASRPKCGRRRPRKALPTRSATAPT